MRGIYKRTQRLIICSKCNKEFETKSTRAIYCPICRSIIKAGLFNKCQRCSNPVKTESILCNQCIHEIHIIKTTCPSCGGHKEPQSRLCKQCYLKHLMPSENNHWKGGRYKSGRGYIFIHSPEHPRVKGKRPYVGEHILVWEETHNKYLPDGWVIHHLNGIRDDNRPENLVAIKPKDHPRWTYIKALQARIRELEQLHLPI